VEEVGVEEERLRDEEKDHEELGEEKLKDEENDHEEDGDVVPGEEDDVVAEDAGTTAPCKRTLLRMAVPHCTATIIARKRAIPATRPLG